MREIKFRGTPGPWVISNWDITDVFEMGHACKWISQPGTTYPDITKDELKYNAQLIAAAPDLLEACETALSYLGDESKWLEGEEILGFQLRSAIKKALGL
jgi:hypothetical protein